MPELTERDFFCPIKYGPRGVVWLHVDDVISEDNPLMHTCAECRQTVNLTKEPKKPHEPGCKVSLMNKLGM